MASNRRHHRQRNRRHLDNEFDNVRSWRNRNPLNIRPLTLPQVWQGQSGVDENPGGPFSIFATRADGWAAGYRNLMAYQDLHGLRTIQSIVSRWAPSADNNDEAAYCAVLGDLTGWSIVEVLDLHDPNTLLNLGAAMSVMEGGRLPWPIEDQQAALALCGIPQQGETT